MFPLETVPSLSFFAPFLCSLGRGRSFMALSVDSRLDRRLESFLLSEDANKGKVFSPSLCLTMVELLSFQT